MVSFLKFSQPPMHITCAARLIILDLLILVVSGEEHKLWSSSLCGYLNFPVTSSILSCTEFNNDI
jgi:hypothetical protein